MNNMSEIDESTCTMNSHKFDKSTISNTTNTTISPTYSTFGSIRKTKDLNDIDENE